MGEVVPQEVAEAALEVVCQALGGRMVEGLVGLMVAPLVGSKEAEGLVDSVEVAAGSCEADA